MKRIALILFVGLAFVAACASTKDFNAQDVSFAQDMIPHHEQAVEMSDMALAQSTSPKVTDLATRIKAAQGPEIQMMKGWLSTWGEPVKASSGGMAGMDHGGGGGAMDMDMGMGMMSDAKMTELRAATGAEFDKLFLTGMVEHHEGAVAMARTELDKGKYEPAKELAQAIIDSQEKEITEMQGLLSGGL